MATIYKRRETRPIPDGAEIVDYRGKPHARWIDRKTGRATRALLNAAGTKIVQEAEFYTIQYFNESGKRKKANTRCADKDAAQQVANALETEVALRKRGVINTKQERFAHEARRTSMEQVADFRAYLTAKGNTQNHIHQTCRQIERIIAACHAENIVDLTGAGVLSVIGELRDGGTSLRTCNAHLRSVKSFTRWLWKEKRTADDALAGLSQFNEETDRRHVRRELTPEELSELIAHVEASPKENYRLCGSVRAMAYRLALGTGFRVKELRTLTPVSFNLDGDPPTVTVAAAYSKRRRQDVQPIRPDLAETLRPWLAGRPRNEQLFRLPHNTAKMFRRDLEAARAAWIEAARSDSERQQREQSDFLKYLDADGRVVDFHSQRHTYISGIVAGGASVKTAQELARHSTPVLTIGRYSHARLHDLTGALETLPSLMPNEPQQQTQATGTDGRLSEEPRGHLRGQLGGKSLQGVASGGETDIAQETEDARHKVLPMNTLGERRRALAKVVRAGVEPATHGFSVRCSTN